MYWPLYDTRGYRVPLYPYPQPFVKPAAAPHFLPCGGHFRLLRFTPAPEPYIIDFIRRGDCRRQAARADAALRPHL